MNLIASNNEKIKNKLNILHIFPSPFKGGSEFCALETIKTLKMHKHHVKIPENSNITIHPNADLEKQIQNIISSL